MILYTPEELRLHLPNHAYDDITSMFGAFRRSEADVLKEKIGAPLYAEMVKHYNAVDESERVPWLLQINGQDAWAELTYLCQQVVVFDAFMRQADINAISVNQSGINVVSAENYDAASKDGIANYKKQLNKEVHAAVNRLLVWLEEGAQILNDLKDSKDSNDIIDESDMNESDGGDSEAMSTIITLWQSSKYFYLIADLFIHTATVFNRYVDIYDSREKFINLLPDLRYCQANYIENELGDTLTADLLKKSMESTGNAQEKKLLNKIREALALCVESRSKLFDRKAARDEAIGSIARMTEYLAWHILDFDPEAVKSFPNYTQAKEQAEARQQTAPEPAETPEPWVNNQPGNAMLVIPAIY